jgi:DNA-binding SARP family transcriptional activator
MEVQLFGPVTVSVGGDPVDVGGPLHQLVVAILASAAGRHTATETLIDQLWSPDAPDTRVPRDPRRRLHELTSELRGALNEAGADGRALLVQKNGGYTLAVNPHRVDLLRFHELNRRADAAMRAEAYDEAARLSRDAVGQWSGAGQFRPRPDPFAGLTAAWATGNRVSLNRAYETALLRRAEADLRLGRHREPIPELLELLELNPYDEHIAGLLMRAYHGAGQSDRATQMYRQFRAGLVDVHGNEPSAGLQELHRRMLAGDPDLTGTTPTPSERRQTMVKNVSKAGGHAKVGIMAAVINGSVHSAPEVPEPDVGKLVRRLRRRLQAAFDNGRVPEAARATADAELARALEHLDGDDVETVLTSLDRFQEVVDGLDDLVDLADEVIAAAGRSAR